jgi:hypothetical protein
MVENDINSIQCKFCTSSFSNDIIDKIKDDRDDVYCENCGDLIKKVQNRYEFPSSDITIDEPKIRANMTSGKPYKDIKPHPDAFNCLKMLLMMFICVLDMFRT